MLAETIETTDSQNFTIKLKNGWTFSNGEKVTAKSFVDAWNYGALITNTEVTPTSSSTSTATTRSTPRREQAKPTAQTMSGLKVVDDSTFTVKLIQKFSPPPHPRLHRLLPRCRRPSSTTTTPW